MTQEQFVKNTSVPKKKIDIILDTDAFNEIDDQFAIAYMLKKEECFNVKAICAAPFYNSRSESAKDGMEKSFDEIFKILKLVNKECTVFKGSDRFLENEQTPVESQAAEFMADIANNYSADNPLYIVAIGAITNVASAILKNQKMKENCVIIWLGGHGIHVDNATSEFNMIQDIAAARIVFGCGIPFVHLPCTGVVDQFLTTKYELEHWLCGKNELCDYLYQNTVKYIEQRCKFQTWSKVIWDVTAIAWLLNETECFMKDKIIPAPMPEYNGEYSFDESRHKIKYVYRIKRDALFNDLFKTLAQ